MANCINAKVNLTIIENGTFDRDFIWEEGNPSVPVNLTNYTAKMTVRTSLTQPDPPLLSLTHKSGPWVADADSGIYFTNPIVGEFKVYITDEDTYGLCADHANITGVYDLFLINPSDEYILKMYGTCKITAAVTRI